VGLLDRPCRAVLLYAVIRDSKATRSGMTRVHPFCRMRSHFLKPAKSRLTVSREVPMVENTMPLLSVVHTTGFGTVNTNFGKIQVGSTTNLALGGGGGNGGQSPLYALSGPRSAQFTLKLIF
jgi:hypothetical protein